VVRVVPDIVFPGRLFGSLDTRVYYYLQNELNARAATPAQHISATDNEQLRLLQRFLSFVRIRTKAGVKNSVVTEFSITLIATKTTTHQCYFGKKSFDKFPPDLLE
jgi:hypothetical protein